MTFHAYECNVGRLVVKKKKKKTVFCNCRTNQMLWFMILVIDGLSEIQQSARTRVREMDRWLSYNKPAI